MGPSPRSRSTVADRGGPCASSARGAPWANRAQATPLLGDMSGDLTTDNLIFTHAPEPSCSILDKLARERCARSEPGGGRPTPRPARGGIQTVDPPARIHTWTPRAGFEPAAFPLGGGRSIHLSYRGRMPPKAYDGRRRTDTKRPKGHGVASSSGTGRVKRKLAPPSTPAGSRRISPPWYSTILRHIARPIPVPEYSSLACSRWKITKMRSA
jgi:hypothetical protein